MTWTPDTLTVRALDPNQTELLHTLLTREAVVPVQSMRDLKRRMAQDRRVFAVLDADDQTLGLVHVALVPRFPKTLDHILAGPVAQAAPRFAVFYGITRTSASARGQAGVLLKTICRALLRERPDLTLATLSPVPGLRAWIERHTGDSDLKRFEQASRQRAAGLAPDQAEAELRALVHTYLDATDDRGRLLDPVARFHLGNGARVRDVLIGADCSWNGLHQALGVMLSYHYPASALGALSADAPHPHRKIA